VDDYERQRCGRKAQCAAENKLTRLGLQRRDRQIRKLKRENAELHEAMADYRERLAVAENFAPPLGRCIDCGGVVAQGYCCDHCGSTDPSRSTAPRQ
jgi:hypothetical protein